MPFPFPHRSCICNFCERKRFAEEGSATPVRPPVASAVAGQEIESKTQFYYDDILFLSKISRLY